MGTEFYNVESIPALILFDGKTGAIISRNAKDAIIGSNNVVKDYPFRPEVTSLSNFSRLDTMVTVVDAMNIFDVLESIETLASNNQTGMLGNQYDSKVSTEVDDRTIVELMLDQIDFANVIVVSKAQKILGKSTQGAKYEKGVRKIELITALLKKLNPKAKIVVSKKKNFADLKVDKVLI